MLFEGTPAFMWFIGLPVFYQVLIPYIIVATSTLLVIAALVFAVKYPDSAILLVMALALTALFAWPVVTIYTASRANTLFAWGWLVSESATVGLIAFLLAKYLWGHMRVPKNQRLREKAGYGGVE